MIKIVAITGGIGCGKSVVCRMIKAMGFAVYDCDSRAKTLMDTSEAIMDGIARNICADAIKINDNGSRIIDRAVLAQSVFSDNSLLSKLNNMVHGAVKADIIRWQEELSAAGYPKNKAYVETAILYQSGLSEIVDEIWEVEAPLDVRLMRAMQRNKATQEQIMARIEAQSYEQNIKQATGASKKHHMLINDDMKLLLPQILSLL